MLTLSTSLDITPSGKGKASWVRLLNGDSEVHDGKRTRRITKDYLVKVAQEWRKANYTFDEIAKREGTKPYRFPAKINHTPDGKRYGDIVDMKVQNGALFAKVEWNDSTWESIQANAYQHISVGIWPEFINQDGEKFGPIVTEISLTEWPRVQGIGTIQETLHMELANMAEQNENKLEDQELEGAVEETSEEVAEDDPKDEDPYEMMYKRLYSALREDLMAALMPQEEEPVEASNVEASNVEEEPVEEEPVEASNVTTMQVEMNMSQVVEALEALRADIQRLTPSTSLPTMELGHEGPANVATPTLEEKVETYRKQGMTLEAAVIKAVRG